MNNVSRWISFLLSLMTVAASSRLPPALGPPTVTLKCSVDYVNLNKTVEVSWKPTLLADNSVSNQDLNDRIQNCEASITCNGGYHELPIGCTYFNESSDSYLPWEFSVPFVETFCSVKVLYVDYDAFNDEPDLVTSKTCSYSTPNLTILKQDSLVSATVGEPYWIHCVISTSEKVNSSIVKIDWRGPNGPIVNSSRIIARPTISNDGIIYNSSLQFLYISQNDTGVFTCNVAILDNNASQVFQLDNLTIPDPNVSVTAFSNKTSSNNLLMLECKITTVRGITDNIDIVWMADGSIIKRTNDSLGNLVNDVILHRDVYHISNVGNNGTRYHCLAMINESSVVTGTFFAAKSSVSTPLPTSTPPTVVVFTLSNSVFPTKSIFMNLSTASPSSRSAATKTSALESSAQVAIIVSVVIGFMFISLVFCLLFYKFRRELCSKNHSLRSAKNDIHFKAPTISDSRYSITDKDDVSTCENLDINDKVVEWIKTMQTTNLNEENDDGYLSNEDILNYVCGQNLRYCNSNQTMECKSSSKVEEGVLASSNHSMANDNVTESVLMLGEKITGGDIFQPHYNDNDPPVFNSCGKSSNQNTYQTLENITEEDHVLPTIESQNKPYVTLNANTKLASDKICNLGKTICYSHQLMTLENSKNNFYNSKGSIIYAMADQVNQDNSAYKKEEVRSPSASCYNHRTTNEEMANSDQVSLDSGDKLTEDTLVSSASLYSITTSSLAEGDYIESRGDAVSSMPNQLPSTSQGTANQFDGKECPMTTIEGEYFDCNTAILHATNES